MDNFVLRYCKRTSVVMLVFGISIGATAADSPIAGSHIGDCFNDEIQLTGETFPDSLRITDADVMWLMRQLHREPRTIVETTQPEPTDPTESLLASE